MRRMRVLFSATVLLLLLLLLSACAGTRAAKATYTDINIEQLKSMLDDPQVFVVNVHVPYIGEIPGTDALVPFDKVAQQLDAFPADKTAPIVVYCRSGSMSAQASKTLAELGYTQVYNVVGGMNAWQAAGYQLVQR